MSHAFPMIPRAVALALAGALFAGCAPEAQDAPESQEASEPASATQDHAEVGAAAGTLPLKEIMQGLERDMADAAHGLWTQDAAAVETAAGGIADHPRVPQEQMAIIQATLGDDFGKFVEFDQAVHGASVALRDLAAQGPPMEDLLAQMVVIQEGCVACHTAYRAKVSEALAAGAAGG